MICGIDEAGRGPVIGPMVVAGVKVNDDGKLIELGVKDSKQLSSKKREELAEKIKDMAEFSYRVVSAEDIDALREDMSLNELEANVFSSVLEDLCDDSDTVYVDSASTDEGWFKKEIRHRMEEKKDLDIVSEHKADENYPVVSAASILAKVERDKNVEKISEELGVDIGSGYPSDVRTKEFLSEWVSENDDLPPYTRRSWQTAKDLLSMAQTKTLDEF